MDIGMIASITKPISWNMSGISRKEAATPARMDPAAEAILKIVIISAMVTAFSVDETSSKR